MAQGLNLKEAAADGVGHADLKNGGGSEVDWQRKVSNLHNCMSSTLPQSASSPVMIGTV